MIVISGNIRKLNVFGTVLTESCNEAIDNWNFLKDLKVKYFSLILTVNCNKAMDNCNFWKHFEVKCFQYRFDTKLPYSND